MTEHVEIAIEVLVGHCLGGAGNDVYPGTILVALRDLSIEAARQKVRVGNARFVPVPPPGDPLATSSPVGGPAPITQRDPVIEHRDPPITAPRRGGRRPPVGGDDVASA